MMYSDPYFDHISAVDQRFSYRRFPETENDLLPHARRFEHCNQAQIYMENTRFSVRVMRAFKPSLDCVSIFQAALDALTFNRAIFLFCWGLAVDNKQKK